MTNHTYNLTLEIQPPIHKSKNTVITVFEMAKNNTNFRGNYQLFNYIPMILSHFNELLHKVQENGFDVIVFRIIAALLIGVFFLASAITLYREFLVGSTISLSICWPLENYFKMNEARFQQVYLLESEEFKQEKYLKIPLKKWLMGMFFSLNGLFYGLAIAIHLLLLIVI